MVAQIGESYAAIIFFSEYKMRDNYITYNNGLSCVNELPDAGYTYLIKYEENVI